MLRCLFILCLTAALFGQTPDSRPTDEASRLNEEGIKLYEAGQYDDAAARFRKAIDWQKVNRSEGVEATIKTNLVYALLGVAVRDIDQSDFGPAERALDESRAVGEKTATVLAHYGLLNLRLGYFDRALSFCNEALQEDAASATALEFRGHVQYRLEELSKAIDDWKKAIEIDPKRSGLKEMIKKVEKELLVEADMQSERTTHFVCKYPEEVDRDVANTLLDWLEDAYSEIGLKFHFYPGGNLTIVLYSSQNFNAATDTHSWAAGLYDGKIRVPVKNFHETREQIRTTIFHEYTHFVVSSLTKQCPVWLNEGLAQVMEGQKSGEWRSRLRAAREGDLLKRFQSMGKTFAGISNPKEAQLAYAQSLSFTEYLIREASLDRVETFLRSLGPKKKMLDTFENVFGRSLDEFEAAWRETL